MSTTQQPDEEQPLLNENSRTHSYTESCPKPLNDPSKTELTLIVFALFSAAFLGALDTTIVATLLTSIGSHFDRAHQSSWLGSAYLLSVCCFTPLYGRLSDIIGRKGAMLLALFLFTTGTLLCGLAPSMNTLIAARAVAGMGGGGVFTGHLELEGIATSDLVPLKRRGLFQGLGNIFYGTGSGLGGPLGGFINDRFGWRLAFLCQIPLLLLSFALVAMFVNVKLPVQPQTTREKLARIDYLGSFTLVIGVGAFLLAVTLIGSEGLPWIHPLVLGLFTSSGVFITAFITVENFVSKEPIVPLRLLREKTPLAIAVVNLTVFFVSYSLMYNVPVYFIAVRLKSSETAGLHLLPYSVAVALGSGVAGLYMKAFGKFYYYTLMSASVFVISSFLMALWKDSTSSLHLWGDVALSGFGMVSLATTTIVALIASVDREDVAVATGIAFTFRTTGQVLGVSLSGTLLQSQLVKHLRERITGAEAERIIETIRWGSKA
ncbi:hypothetical protein FRB95_012887 [Tulasnella sp. JGI-2019a]|nr:hypothetical protein FRB95_012887 [Tulasnella sp. JGI-2019a]